jgi:hypothetical protein
MEEFVFDERWRATFSFIASWLNGHTPARQKPSETALVVNELLNRSFNNFGKSIFRIVFRWVRRK